MALKYAWPQFKRSRSGHYPAFLPCFSVNTLVLSQCLHRLCLSDYGFLLRILIQAQNLTKKFATLMVVDHIEFKVYKGECIGFLGLNDSYCLMKYLFTFANFCPRFQRFWRLGQS